MYELSLDVSSLSYFENSSDFLKFRDNCLCPECVIGKYSKSRPHNFTNSQMI